MPGDAFKAASGADRLLELNASMDAYPEALRLLSTDGVIEYMNPAAMRLSEMTDFELLRGRPWVMFWPEPAQAALKDALVRSAAGETVTFRAARRAAQGTQQWLENTVSPIRDESGAVVRLMAVSRDVTDAIESDAFLETLVRRLPNPLLVKSARDGRYVLINRAAEEAFGVSAEEWTGKTAFELFPRNEAELFAAEDADVIASGETRVSEEEAITTRNGVRFFTTKKFATYDGDRPLHLVTLGEDVTERREASVALKGALAEAEQANRAKSEFLANMSHEIRTPLNGIVAGADMLARCELDPRAKELAEIIGASAATLERLLSDVLDLARIEAGRITLDAAVFHLGDLIRATAGLARLQADEKDLPLGVDIAPEVDTTFEGDPHRIRQVLVNLLSNAVKFTERGAVTVTAEAGADGGVKVSVADTGIGFKPELKEKIFGRFQQVDGSITRRFGGTGLGMTISRELVGLMGGVIDAEGREGAGATFWFELPLQRAELQTPVEKEQPQGPAQMLRVLLADDHPTNRKVVQLMLEGLAEVVCAEHGREALMAYGSGPFDLVLMDMQMPVMDGLAATRRIRDSERASGKARTPVIMLTANALPEHVAASLAAGADRHLEKPVTLASLLEAINEVLADRPAGEAAATHS